MCHQEADTFGVLVKCLGTGWISIPCSCNIMFPRGWILNILVRLNTTGDSGSDTFTTTGKMSGTFRRGGWSQSSACRGQDITFEKSESCVCFLLGAHRIQPWPYWHLHIFSMLLLPVRNVVNTLTRHFPAVYRKMCRLYCKSQSSFNDSDNPLTFIDWNWKQIFMVTRGWRLCRWLDFLSVPPWVWQSWIFVGLITTKNSRTTADGAAKHDLYQHVSMLVFAFSSKPCCIQPRCKQECIVIVLFPMLAMHIQWGIHCSSLLCVVFSSHFYTYSATHVYTASLWAVNCSCSMCRLWKHFFLLGAQWSSCLSCYPACYKYL